MKKTVIIIILITVLFFLGNKTTYGGWGMPTLVDTYYIWSDGDAHFRVINMENPDGCINPRYLTLDSNASNFDKLYNDLRMAYYFQETVQLSYNGCTPGGLYPLIKSIAPYIW